MSRLIDADKLKKYLLEKFGPSQDSTVLFLYGLIAEQPTVEQDNWITCSERLPDEGYGYYLVSKKGYDMVRIGYYSGGSFENRDVIAWQPLPRPVKEVDLR